MLRITLEANNDNKPATAIEHYVAEVKLPARLDSGKWSVEVSRDGMSWVPLAGQVLTVEQDEKVGSPYSVSSYGCRPNDDEDDTNCIQAAIIDAASTGGRVIFEEGTWDLGSASKPAPAPNKDHGLIVPINVNLEGKGDSVTTIRRSVYWDASPVFTLLGLNTVTGIKFKDTAVRAPSERGWIGQAFLQIGWTADPTSWGNSTVVDRITISNNTFDNPVIGIREGGFPIRHLWVTYNKFGAWSDGILLSGPYMNLPSQPGRAQFNVQDSIFAFNNFKPGGYYDPAIRQGTIASQVGAAQRVDWSDNKVDGQADVPFIS